jgi:hypothetical protein
MYFFETEEKKEDSTSGEHMSKEKIWKAILSSSSSGSKEVLCEHKNDDNYTFCGLCHVKHYIPISKKKMLIEYSAKRKQGNLVKKVN